MMPLKTDSRFNHWLNKKSFTAVLFCLFAVCYFGFDAAAANAKSFPKTKKVKFAAPVITSFYPVSGAVGTIITINGNNFTDASLVKIGNAPAVILSRTSNTITAMVMPGAVNSDLGVYNGGESSIKYNAFTITVAEAAIMQEAGKVGYLEGRYIALSADGNTMAVRGANRISAKDMADLPPHPSDATVYKRTTSGWTVYAEITGEMLQLSADGKTLMNRTGIYIDNGSGAFVLQYTFPVTAGIGSGTDYGFDYGSSTALSADGKLALVGSGGLVYTYKNTNGTWAPSGSNITEVSHANTFGFAVSLSADGKTALITDSFAKLPKTAGSNSGHYPDSLGAWVYIRQGDNWVKQAQLPTLGSQLINTTLPSNNTQAISANGDRIIITKINNGNIIFNRTDGKWSATTPRFLDYHGGSTVSMSADGKTIMFPIYLSYSNDAAHFGVTIIKESGGKWTTFNSGYRQFDPADHTTDHRDFIVGALSADGNVAVTSTLGYWNSGVIVHHGTLPVPPLIPVPPDSSITITPSTGPIGTIVTISGNNLNGVKQFSIGGKPVTLISNDGTNFLGMVAAGTAGGVLAITNADNQTIGSSASFNVTAPPAIPLSTGSAKFGTTVTSGNTDINQGYSVAISANGTTAVLGAPNYANGKGALVIFTRNNAGAWVQQGPVLVNPYSNPALGVSVAISADGNTVIGGGHKMANATTGFFSIRAATVLFTRTGTTWTAGADFGLSEAVALSGDGKVAILGTVEPDPYTAPHTILTMFVRDYVGTGYTAIPRNYGVGFSNFISMAFSSGRTLVIGQPLTHTTSDGRGGSTTQYGMTSVLPNVDDVGNNMGDFSSFRSSVYQGQGFEGSMVAISGDGKVIVSGGVATNPVTFRRSNNDIFGWTQEPGVMLGAAGGQVSLNVDGTVALVVKANGATFYKWNGTSWGNPLDALPNTAGLTAAALTPDATKALLGFAFDPNGGAAQVFENAGTPTPPAVAPTSSTTKLVFTNTTSNSTTVSWTKGNGAKRAVFIAKTANGVAAPVNNTTYTANTAFGTGTQIGATGWYAIYNGDGNTVNITGLASSATYRVTVVEYNGVDSDEKYLLKNLAPASIVTAISPNDPPTVPSLQLAFSNITATTTNVSWTSGNGAMRAVFVAKTANGVAAPADDNIYTANTTFGNGTQIGGTGWYCVYNGTGNSTNVSGLLAGSTYRVTVVEYNTTGSIIRYMNTKLAPASVVTLLSPAAAPTVPSLRLTFSNITPTGTTVNWNSGNGAKRAVFVARTANGVVNAFDNTTYTANPAFASGTQVGATGWYCVYNGTANSANITGLTPSTIYRITVIEYNGDAGNEKYMNTKLNPASVITGATAPTVPSLKLTFSNTTASTTNVSWTSGNGTLRAVFVARTANGVANAVDNTTYTANQNFAVGTQIGSTGWYCVYNGSGNNTNITGLDAYTTYRVTVIEYNGGAGTQLYMNNKLNPASITTLPTGPVPPNVPSLRLNFSNTTSNATTVNWTSGNGFRRAVFVARRSDGVAAPIDNTPYMGNPTFGAGAQIGATGWYCVYNGVGNSADITGLTPGTVYRVTVVEFNGSINSEKYMLTRLAPASIITSTGSGLHSTLGSLKTDTPAGGEVVAGDIEASNLLSPNGDGKNDTWMVKNIEQYQNNSVTVFDQGSNVVYSKKGYTNDWAGTYRGGVVKQGTYYYLIDLGNGTTKKGFITVLSSRQ